MRVALAAFGGGWVALAASCGFPEHTFIPDDEFDNAAGGLADASTGGGTGAVGGGGTGGAGGVGGTSASGGSAGETDGGGTGGAVDGGNDADAAGCATELTDCGGGLCVDTTSNANHCGGCDAPCSPGRPCIQSSCSTSLEDCLNGTDDDSDGDVDCADADCAAGFICAATPAGWTGPVVLWSGAAGTAPLCSGDYPNGQLSAFFDLVVPPYQCPACTCEPASGASCDNFRFRFRNAADCTGTGWIINPFPPDTCLDPGAFTSDMLQSAFLAHPTGTGAGTSSDYATGSCQLASVPNPSFPTPTWNVEAVACGDDTPPASGGCGANKCMPKPTAPFGATLCVFRSGTFSCPASYPNPQPDSTNTQYFESYSDGRGCSTCSCGSLACGGNAYTYTDLACTTDATPIPLDGSCAVIPPDPTRSGNSDTRSLRYSAAPTCGNASRAVTGGVTTSAPVTVCCQ